MIPPRFRLFFRLCSAGIGICLLAGAGATADLASEPSQVQERKEKQKETGGPLKADVIQYPVKIGRTTIEVIAKHLAGKEVDPEYPIEVGIVDKAAIESGE